MIRPDQIAVSALPGDVRAAWLASGRLLRLALTGPEPTLGPGDIVLGRVTAVARGLEAAFVDIGGDRPGLLMLKDAAGGTAPGEGDAVVVQVVREAEGRKGPKLTGRPTLAGRTVTFAPFGRGVSHDDAPAKAGPIDREIDELRRRWRDVTAAAAAARPPARLLRRPDPVTAAVGEGLSPALDRIVVEDIATGGATRAALAAAFPEAAGLIEPYRDGRPLFAALGIDEAIEAALDPVVALPGGGVLTIVETEAVVAVDVDLAAAVGGRGSVLAVDLEAAAVLGREVRLRELGGHIVVDFVPLGRRDQRARVVDALRRAFAGDDRQIDVAGYTRLGLVEMTRERRGPSLRRRLTVSCPACAGGGHAPRPTIGAGDGLRALLAAARTTPARAPVLAAAADVIAALRGPLAPAVAACGQRLGRAPVIVAEPALPAGRFRIDG